MSNGFELPSLLAFSSEDPPPSPMYTGNYIMSSLVGLSPQINRSYSPGNAFLQDVCLWYVLMSINKSYQKVPHVMPSGGWPRNCLFVASPMKVLSCIFKLYSCEWLGNGCKLASGVVGIGVCNDRPVC